MVGLSLGSLIYIIRLLAESCDRIPCVMSLRIGQCAFDSTKSEYCVDETTAVLTAHVQSLQCPRLSLMVSDSLFFL